MKHSDDIAQKCAELDSCFGVDSVVTDRIMRFSEHLAKWQKAINLIGRSTESQVWERHILDSLQLIPHIPEHAKTLIDLGSGAGFPGLILALFDRWHVHLVESDSRKAVFLRDSARHCGVKPIVHACRIETMLDVKADVITARALASVADLLRLSADFRQSRTSHLFLKGRNAEAELTDAQKTWTLHVHRIPSITDPHGVILKIDEVRQHGSGSTA